jgi:hypothetical protein
MTLQEEIPAHREACKDINPAAVTKGEMPVHM